MYVGPWIFLSALALGSVSFPPSAPPFVGLGMLDQPSPPADAELPHGHTQKADLRAPIKRLAKGTGSLWREANERKDLVPKTVLARRGEKGAGRIKGTGRGGGGDSLSGAGCGGFCPVFSVLGHGVVRIKIGQRRPFRTAGSKRRRLRGTATPAFFRAMDGPLVIGVEVRLGLFIDRGDGLIGLFAISMLETLFLFLFFVLHAASELVFFFSA